MKIYFLLQLIFIAFPTLFENINASNDERLDRKVRIIGGSPVSDKEYLYVVKISAHCALTDLYYSCSGSIISPRHVLTSASCIICDRYQSDPDLRFAKKFMIYTHESHWYYWFYHSYYEVARKVVLASYNFPGAQDIGVLELMDGQKFSIPPITIAAYTELNTVHTMTLLGYGLHGERDIDDNCILHRICELHKVEIPMYVIATYQMTGGHAQKMAWKGDGGGPLVKNINNVDYLFGIVSFYSGSLQEMQSEDFDNRHIITGFLRTSAYCSFIKQATNGSATCKTVSWYSSPFS